MSNPFGLKASNNEQRTSALTFSRSTRENLGKLCGVEFKGYDPAQDAGKVVVRPRLRHGMVVCGPCGNKVINFSHYCEVRGDGSYGPSGGGWEVVVCTCPEHGQTVMRATWKDLVAHKGELIVAFTEVGSLPDHQAEPEPTYLPAPKPALPEASGESDTPLTIDV